MSNIDFASTNSAALARYPGILESWLPGGRLSGREYVCANLQGGEGGSLSVNIERGTWADFATDESGSDPVSLFAAIHNIGQGEAARRLADELNVNGSSTPEPRKKKSDWTPILPVPDDAPAPPATHYSKGRPVASWKYRDQQRRLLSLVCRFEHGGGKEILPLCFSESEDGKRAWRWQSMPTPRPLYGLDRLKDHSAVVIVEGEKAADAAQRMFGGKAAVVTWPGGSKAVRKADFTPLKGKRVLLWPDADEPGEKAMPDVAAILSGIGVLSLKILPPPEDAVEGWDAADAEADGWTHERTMQEVKARAVEMEASKSDVPGAVSCPPTPLYRETPPPDPYPFDALGDVLGQAAAKIHEIIKAPDAVCAQSVLGAAALAIQPHANAVIDGRRYPLSLFMLTVSDSGERKSAVDEVALWPVRRRERDLEEAYRPALHEYEIKSAAWQKSREQALRSTKASMEEKEAALRELGPAPTPPTLPMLLVSEPTLEGLVKMLAAGQPAIGLFSDEGAMMVSGHAMNQENRLKTAGGICRLWGGQSIDRVRAGDGCARLHGRRLSLHLLMQPGVAMRMIGDADLRDQGLLARCLIAAPLPMAGTRDYYHGAAFDEPEVKQFHARILDALEAPYKYAAGDGGLEPRDLPLAKDAYELWVKFYRHVESQLGDDGDLAPVRAFGSKIPEHITRLAGVMTLIDDLHAPAIQVDAVDRAIALAEYYLSEALRLHGASTTAPELSQAQKVLDWIQGRDLVSLPCLYQFGPSFCRDAASARKVVDVLEAHGWLVKKPGGGEVDGVTRREVWQVRTT